MFSHIIHTEHTEKEVKEILEYEQPTNYIVDTPIYSNNSTQTPVLTANKAFILGYTDEKHNTYNKGECIVFDDFTMDSKFVNFRFKVKSSAIKILRAKENNDTYFISQYLMFMKLRSEEHKRHYISEVESMCILIPNLALQKKIATTLRLIDESLSNELAINHLYEKQKQYILTKMFI